MFKLSFALALACLATLFVQTPASADTYHYLSAHRIPTGDVQILQSCVFRVNSGDPAQIDARGCFYGDVGDHGEVWIVQDNLADGRRAGINWFYTRNGEITSGTCYTAGGVTDVNAYCDTPNIAEGEQVNFRAGSCNETYTGKCYYPSKWAWGPYKVKTA
jgi:hypothetical protein